MSGNFEREPTGSCECGCGQTTKLSDRTDPKRGVVRGLPLRFVNGHAWKGKRRSVDRWTVEDRGYESDCWIWQGPINRVTGYGTARHRPAHRAVYEELVGPIPAGAQLDHLCRIHSCVNPDHLEPVTNAVNTRRGDRTRLTWAEVEEIRRSTLSHRSLADRFGVHPAHISKIKTGKSWVAV